MGYKLLGRSGLRVSELGLGTMTFGTDWGWDADKDKSRAMFDAFAEAGGNFIDTANRYTNGTSEDFVLIGARKLSQMVDNVGWVDVTLTADQHVRLHEASKIELGFPYDFIRGGHSAFMGPVSDHIDDHRNTVV